MSDEQLIQLATRITKGLHRELKIHCVRSSQTVGSFVAKALQNQLKKEAGK